MKKWIIIMTAASLLAGFAQAQTVHFPKMKASELGGDSLTFGTRKESGSEAYQGDYETQYRYFVEYGTNTVAIGDDVVSKGRGTVAMGYGSFADGQGTIAAGRWAKARETDDYAVVWSGNFNRSDYNPYEAKGPGTFCVDPNGGAEGFYIGDSPLSSLLGGGGGGGLHTVPVFTDYYDEYNTNRTVVTFPYELSLSNGTEQYFQPGSGSDTNRMIILPEAYYDVVGHLTIYLKQNPSSNSYFDFDDGNYRLHGLPSSRPWLTDTNGNGIWKVEFESVPDMPNWFYEKSTKYEM